MNPKVRDIYKQLLYIGKEYPKGYDYFRSGLKRAFLKKKDLPDSEIDKAVEHGKFVYRELEALWFLKKYRTLKRNYDPDWQDMKEKELERMQSPSRLSLLKKTSFLGSDDRIVIDFGSAFTKFGFSSEPTPRYIIPTKKSLSATFKEIFRLMIITDQGQRKVYENIPLLNYHTSVQNAGSNVERRFKALLIEHGKLVGDIRQTGIPIDENLELDIQDLTVRMCRASKTKVVPGQSSCKDLFYRINHNTLLKIPGWIREQALEELFERNIEVTDLPSKVLDCIMKCPTDIRSDICSNIVLVGGTSMFTLLGTRLHLELINLTDNSEKYSGLRRLIAKFRYSACPFQPIIIPWIGGSLAGVTKMNNSNEVKRENYSGEVSDWAFDLHGLEG
ncbi:Actin- protein 3B [Boothiomyces sp. JEL0866]|nr:Actin- protein 3B [Boothiomyces sp. JEL0866]